MSATIDVDVAVIGSGFAGSITAMALRSMGRRVALIERDRHPRFAIGESSTPLANLLLEELADRYSLEGIRPFTKWGRWQRERPDIAGGVKRGFTFFFHDRGSPFPEDACHERQLLVAASPRDEVADTHWYRPDLDHELARQAEMAGAIYLDRTRVTRLERRQDAAHLEAERDGGVLRITAPFVIDASGPRGFLHRALGLGERALRWLPPTQGLYTHFTNVARWDGLHATAETPPYPVDDAALHHVFPGGWIWMLRFANGITSAGAALTDGMAAEIHATDKQAAWQRLLGELPSVARQFAGAATERPFVHAPRLAFRSARVAGPGWALLPSAAGVIDPLLSTGFPLTLLGMARLLDILGGTRAGGDERHAALRDYERTTLLELDTTERLVGALYAVMGDAVLFKRLSLLYFAAASFSETVRRLGRPHLAPGFLLSAHPAFALQLAQCSDAAAACPRGKERLDLLTRIDRAIAPFDAAGLLDRSRQDWYPVRADDLLASAGKLGATADEVHRLLTRSGFTSGEPST